MVFPLASPISFTPLTEFWEFCHAYPFLSFPRSSAVTHNESVSVCVSPPNQTYTTMAFSNDPLENGTNK